MTTTLLKIFNIQPGESRHALLFLCLGFLWSLSASCSVTLADAMFITINGAHLLPTAYIFTAILQFLFAALTIYILNKHSVNISYKYSLYIITLIYLTFTTQEINTNVTFAFKIFANVAFVVLITSFWNFIDQYFHLDTATRLYSLLNGSSFLGMAAGGGLLLVLDTKTVHSTLYIAIGSLLLSLILISYIEKITPIAEEEEQALPPPKEKLSLPQVTRLIVSSRFTLLLIIVNTLMFLLEMITEFKYMNCLETLFSDKNPEALTQFLGTCKAWTSIACTIFSTVFYSRITQRFGVHNLMLSSPTLFCLIFLSWPLAPYSILIAVTAFVAVEGTSYVINDNCVNLLINHVPKHIRPTIRVLSDSFFEPIALLFSGLLLYIPGQSSPVITLILAITVLIFYILLRNRYLNPNATQHKSKLNELAQSDIAS